MTQAHCILIIGAGPAGLALAQYAATRGYSVLVLDERYYPGGRAATSPFLRNVPGFPQGITGKRFGELLYEQALELGAEIRLSSRVTGLRVLEDTVVVDIADHPPVTAHVVVLATGLKPRRGDIIGAEQFTEGAGIWYEPPSSFYSGAGKQVVVYGAGNAAGQTTIALAKKGARVRIIMREKTLESAMAPYLIRDIARLDTITELIGNAQVTAVDGDTHLATVHFKQGNGAQESVSADELYVILGGEPDTAWLSDIVHRDSSGRVCVRTSDPYWVNTRIFAIGDVADSAGHTVMAAYGDAARVLETIRAHA